MPLCDNSRLPIGTNGGGIMQLLLELIYAEIHSLAENISYLKGRCDSILEMCTTYRLVHEKECNRSMYEKELWILEEKLQKIKNELNKFVEQIPNQLGNDIKNFETNIIKKRSQYIKTMQGID